jgi:hypothetical protein
LSKNIARGHQGEASAKDLSTHLAAYRRGTLKYQPGSPSLSRIALLSSGRPPHYMMRFLELACVLCSRVAGCGGGTLTNMVAEVNYGPARLSLALVAVVRLLRKKQSQCHVRQRRSSKL